MKKIMIFLIMLVVSCFVANADEWIKERNADANQDSIRTQYIDALTAIEEGNYLYAKRSLMSIIEDHPKHILSCASAKKLLKVVGKSDQDYCDLQAYYDDIVNTSTDSSLVECCEDLSNKCSIELRNFSQAVKRYESIISEPETLRELIYALIDLNNTYLLMDDISRERYLNPFLSFNPLTRDNFHKRSRGLKEVLLNGENLHNMPVLEDVIICNNLSDSLKSITSINFSITEDSKVEMVIYNIKGQEVKVLTDKVYLTGEYSIIWNGENNSGKNVPFGVYYCNLVIEGANISKKEIFAIEIVHDLFFFKQFI